MNDRPNTHPQSNTHTDTDTDRDRNGDVNGNGTNHSEDVSMQQHSVSAPATTSTETTTSASSQPQPHPHPTETQANSSTLSEKHRPQPLAVAASFDSDFSSTTNSTFAQSDTRRSFSYAESAATIGESSVSSYFPLQKYLKRPQQQQQQQYGVRSPDRVSSGNRLSSSSPLSDGAAVAELALPSGWTTAARAQDGRMYYWNVATGETRWDHPGVSMKDARAPPPSSSSNYRSGGVGCNVEKSSDLCGFRNESVIGETIEKGGRKQLGRECHVMDRNISAQAQTYQSPTKDKDINALHEYSTPNGNANSPLKQRSPLLQDTPTNANLRPDSHQCCAVISFFAFPPLGCCAVFHSCMVDRAWSQGRYGDAVNHSRQSYNYAWFGVVVFIVLFVYYAVSGKDFEWENWIPTFGD